MDISICIPVYNVAPYLKRCLDSLFTQDFEGTFEVICVDDASTDDSFSILTDYQRNEPRLKVMQLPERKKISVVRTTALQAASGNYIMQVDSDDWLQQGALAALHRKCMETGADIVVYDYLVDDSGEWIQDRHFTEDGLFRENKSKIQPIFNGAACCKVVKRALIADLLFYKLDVSWGDDFLFNTEILLKAESICLLPAPYYVYCINQQSITYSIRKSEYEMLEDRIASVDATSEMLHRFSASYQHKLSLLNYHKYKLLILLLRVSNRDAVREKQLIRLADSMRRLPEMTKRGRLNVSLTIKYPLYALIYMAFRIDFKQALGVFYNKYIKR